MPRSQRPPALDVNIAGRAVLTTLTTGTVEVVGMLPYSSNYTYLARVGGMEEELLAVYKPQRGERPLWDFPSGTLAGREVAAYLVSESGGFDIVPPTVLRKDAPLGPGSLQLFIDHDLNDHYFTLIETRKDELEAFAAFDVVINNADRKAGHVLQDASGRLWAVDHGVGFHVDPKLRTVIWEFAGRPVSEAVGRKLRLLCDRLGPGDGLRAELEGLLTRAEADATLTRTRALLDEGVFPPPRGHHPLPWPLV